MRMTEESEKPGLKPNIQKTRIIASGPITSWQIEGEKVEAATDFSFLSWALKSLLVVITAIQLKMLAPWKESYNKPRQHIKKQRHHC